MGHLLGKSCPLFCIPLPFWCLEQDLEFDCIDSCSLHFHLLFSFKSCIFIYMRFVPKFRGLLSKFSFLFSDFHELQLDITSAYLMGRNNVENIGKPLS